MKKYLLTLITAIMCMFLLAIFVSADTYTVSSNDEYETAYASAIGGDTIIVNSKLTCDIYANKSITYVLKADWESPKLVVNESNVEVSFIADGGNYRIMPTNYSTTDGWMNIATAYENVVINLGGANGGTLTIDGSNATHDRVSYTPSMPEAVQYDMSVFPNICLNLLSGSAIANFNTTTKDDNVNACILYAKTVNMYDGAQIYANKIISAPLIKSCYFNLYGGEIFGNVLESIRMGVSGMAFIYADRHFVMYDGRISENIFNTKNGKYQFNVSGFITTNQYYYGSRGVAVLGGEVGDRYVSGAGNNEISAVFGVCVKDNGQTNFCYNTGIEVGNRYTFTDTPQLTFDQTTGKTIWKVSTFTDDISENNYGYCWNSIKKTGDKVAVFLDAEKKTIAGNNFDIYTVINAYIDGAYAHSGSNTIAIPSGYSKWSTSGTQYCHTGKAYTLDEVKAAGAITLYTAYDAEKVTENAITSCSGCGLVYKCENPDHNHIILSVDYESYLEDGIKATKCVDCDSLAMEEVVSALFKCLGYSATETGKAGITIGFVVDNVAIDEYKSAIGKEVNYGIFAVVKDRLGDNDVFANDGTLASGAISADFTSHRFDLFELRIVDFKDEHKDIEIAMGAYVAVTENGIAEYHYLQPGTPEENESYCFVSYNSVMKNSQPVE